MFDQTNSCLPVLPSCIIMLCFRKLRREERVLRGRSIEEEKEEGEEEEEKEEKEGGEAGKGIR